MRSAVSILLILTLVACSSRKAEDGTRAFPAAVPLGHEYTLGFGKTLTLEGGLSIEFTTLAEDSRCPTGVQCVWEGNGRILVTAVTSRGVHSVELNTSSRFATRAVFDSYAVELRKLAPYPVNGASPGQTASVYEATLFVGGVQ